jgi:integrase
MLNRAAMEVVERQRGKHSERVFTYESRPVTRVLNTSWKKARIKADLPHLRVHDLRHTFGHRLRAAGVHSEDRKALLGHTNGDITTHYSAPDLHRLQEFVERIVDHERATILRIRNQGGQESGAKVGQKVGHSAQLGKPVVST